MLSVQIILAMLALLLAAGSVAYPERTPLWAAVILLCVLALLQAWPAGR